MKRILWLAAMAAAVWGLPRLSHPAVDVGKLDPVEAVLLEFGPWGISVETDTGARGSGETLEEALEDLTDTAETNVFLDTTGKLLISGNPEEYWPEIFRRFRPSCMVCRAEGDLDLKEAAAYLTVHKPELTLNRLRAGEQNWQTLRMKDGRGYLEPE